MLMVEKAVIMNWISIEKNELFSEGFVAFRYFDFEAATFRHVYYFYHPFLYLYHENFLWTWLIIFIVRQVFFIDDLSLIIDLISQVLFNTSSAKFDWLNLDIDYTRFSIGCNKSKWSGPFSIFTIHSNL